MHQHFRFVVAQRGPAHTINYFIAAAACRNSAKRLPSNAEWQVAALGTPDPWPQDDPSNQCNISTPSVSLTGSRSKCISDVGAYDMVGNVIEFVGDWGALATAGNTWDMFIPGFGNDVSNMGGAPNGTIYGLPGTTLRGGSFATTPNSGGTGEQAGVYAIDQNGAPNSIGDASAPDFVAPGKIQDGGSALRRPSFVSTFSRIPHRWIDETQSCYFRMK